MLIVMVIQLSLWIGFLEESFQKLPLLFNCCGKGMYLFAQLCLILSQLPIRKITTRSSNVGQACMKGCIQDRSRVTVRVLLRHLFPNKAEFTAEDETRKSDE